MRGVPLGGRLLVCCGPAAGLLPRERPGGNTADMEADQCLDSPVPVALVRFLKSEAC